MKHLLKYDHIIWDWNGTLLNDTHICVDIINGVLKRRNLQTLTPELYRDIFTFPVKDYYKSAGFNFDVYPFEIVGKEWMDEYEIRKYEPVLHKSALDILIKLNQEGKPQSILSAYYKTTLLEMIEHHNITSYFSHLAGLDNIYADGKTEIGRDLVNKIKNDCGKIVLIGDTLHDYDVANELEIDCILIANGHQSMQKLKCAGVPVYQNLEELINTE